MKHSLRLAVPLLATVLMLGCSSRKLIPGFATTGSIDLVRFSSQGFLITTESYAGAYDAVGPIEVTVFPEAQRLPDTSRSSVDLPWFGTERRNPNPNSGTPRKWRVQIADYNYATERLFEEAKAMGADAVINFRYKRVDHPFVREAVEAFNKGEPGPSDMLGVEVSGFAIRRK